MMPALTPPSSFSADSYLQHWLHERTVEYTTVMDALFCPNGEYLVCGGDDGRLAVWDFAEYMEKSSWESSDGPDRSPHLSFQVGNGRLNCLKFMPVQERQLLLAGGDSQISVWYWDDIVACVSSGDAPPSPCMNLAHTSKHRAHTSVEVNGISVDRTRLRVIGAYGDGLAREYDAVTGRIVRNYSGHKGYLHTTQMVPDVGLVLTGGDDGLVGVWDSRARGSVDFFSPVDRICEAGLLNRKEGALESNGSWVSSMRVDPAANWLSCGGGSTALPNSNTVGWVGLCHLPSRSVTSASVLPAATQGMVFSDDSLVTVGNEPFLSYFKWEALQLRTRVKTTSRSCFALAVNKHSKYKGVTAVGGCSPCIDVYTYPGTQAFALTAQ